MTDYEYIIKQLRKYHKIIAEAFNASCVKDQQWVKAQEKTKENSNAKEICQDNEIITGENNL